MAFEFMYWFILVSFSIISAFEVDCDLNKFRTSNIVPNIIPTIPQQPLLVRYKKKEVTCGNMMMRAETKDHPTNLDFKADQKKLYTFIMFDPDTPTPQNPKESNYRHWMFENVPGNIVQNGDPVTIYNPPEPPQYSDPHRFIFLIYEQTRKLKDHFDDWKRTNFDLKKFVKDRGLKGPIAGNFFLQKD